MALISKSEWEIMRVVWTKKSVTSKELIADLSQSRDWSASTIKTLLGRLVAKGILDKQGSGRTYCYQALLSEEQALAQEGKILLSRICTTKQAHFLMDLLADLPLTETSWQELSNLLRQKEDQLVTEIVCQCPKGQCACSSCQKGVRQ